MDRLGDESGGPSEWCEEQWVEMVEQASERDRHGGFRLETGAIRLTRPNTHATSGAVTAHATSDVSSSSTVRSSTEAVANVSATMILQRDDVLH